MKWMTISLLSLTFVAVAGAAPGIAPQSSTREANAFNQAADVALSAMRERATDLKIGGVAVVAYMPGQELQSWSSKMVVVGRYKDLPSATEKGANLLGIAYAKASEMADTLKDSGDQSRPPMTGEFGWKGGVIARGRNGYLIAAFSGGKSEDDVEVSHTGLAKLKAGLGDAGTSLTGGH